MKPWKLAVLCVVAALIIGVAIKLYLDRGLVNTPMFMAVEISATEYHKRYNSWPRSYEETRPFAEPEHARQLETRLERAGIQVRFEPSPDHLKITYTGRNFTIVRYLWKHQNYYGGGNSLEDRSR